MHPELPCHPCPHRAACCAYGTTLTDEEAASLTSRFGDVAYRTRWGEWRTRVKGRRCVFFAGDGGCTIHADASYPKVCRGFPWTDAETGGPYEFDRTICPEFVLRPELVRIDLPA